MDIYKSTTQAGMNLLAIVQMELFHLCVPYVYQQGFKKRVVIHVQPLAQLVHNFKVQWDEIHT
jgi:hypothetical protein